MLAGDDLRLFLLPSPGCASLPVDLSFFGHARGGLLSLHLGLGHPFLPLHELLAELLLVPLPLGVLAHVLDDALDVLIGVSLPCVGVLGGEGPLGVGV